jgi:rubrerythrin
MFKPTDIGPNRTGIAMSPIDSQRTIQAAAEAGAVGPDGHALELERVRWCAEAVPLGTVPPPGTVKGVIKAVVEKLEGHSTAVFVDKLGERLAFERTGTRLYEALLAKFEAASVHEDGPTRDQLEKIHDDEIRHFAIVRDAMLQLGADPTAMTPSADVIGVAGTGWVQVLTDPRSTLSQCLVVMLSAEVADKEGWDLLVTLAESLGFEDIGTQFRLALIEEEQHAMQLRAWVSNAVLGQSGAKPT